MPSTKTDNTSPNIDFTSPYTPRRPSPIVSISINHPIGTLLRKIKNFLVHKQTLFSTTFTIKITPIVALVSLAGVAALFGGGVTTAYNFGKTVEQKFMISLLSPTPASGIAAVGSLTPTPASNAAAPIPVPVLISRAGILRATYQPVAAATSVPIISVAVSPELTTIPLSPIPLIPTITPTPYHFVLTTGNTTVFLSAPTTITLSSYLNQRVLVTGILDTTKNTLTISKPGDIEILGK